jgi:hypothetical protein
MRETSTAAPRRSFPIENPTVHQQIPDQIMEQNLDSDA